MTKRNLLLTLLILLLPILIFAQEASGLKGANTVWDMLLAPKYIAGFILIIIQLAIFWSNKLSDKVRIISLVINFIMFGIYFPLHPSPICSFTKPFIYGLRTPFLAGIIFIGAFSLISSKGFCGTICPAGSLQELLYRINIFPKLRKNYFPFYISNIIRVGVALLFFAVVLLLGETIFAYFSLFELFHWSFDLPVNLLLIFIASLIIMLGASLILFRPFCYYVCPVGLVTWLLEQVSFLKVRVDKDKCTQCGSCETEAPCPAMSDILNEKNIKADCHICGMCFSSCPENAIYFGNKNKQK
jgi:polyferredoxin